LFAGSNGPATLQDGIIVVVHTRCVAIGAVSVIIIIISCCCCQAGYVTTGVAHGQHRTAQPPNNRSTAASGAGAVQLAG